MDATLAVDLELPPLATSAGEARRLLRGALADLEDDVSFDAAQVAVSEIVTNALVHAGTVMRLRVLLADGDLRVELLDGSPHLPRQRGYSAVAATGRGLHMISEMVDRWGAYPDPEGEGKVVWFEILRGSPGSGDLAAVGDVQRTTAPTPDDTVRVELRNMPLLMHAAWQEHASGLLREIMLIRLDEDLSALERHAAASDALNLLFEQVPAPDLGDDPEAIMAAATEPGVSAEVVALQVPAGSLASFELLEVMLEEVVAIADGGGLLSPPTQPELRVMRRWLCEEVRRQHAGQPPVPWVSTTDARPPTASAPLDWDVAEVDDSPRALLAADDANRIVAVSDAALAALGHSSRTDVVGQRLISIIPVRYHQAHIAGFTLHLVNGRSPLLGHVVTVPVVGADGSEAEVRVRVDGTVLPSGRRVFVAELFL